MKRVFGALVLNQGTDDDAILELKSSDVAHGMTTVTETDTYCKFGKIAGASGGVHLMALADGGARGLMLSGVGVGEDTTKAVGALGAVYLNASKQSGTGAVALGANGNIMVVATDGTVRFIMDADGDSHQDLGTAWTNFDDHNDVELLTQLSVQVSRPDDPIRSALRTFVEMNRTRLEALRLVTFNEDGHHFINWSRTSMLLIGAVRQLHGRLEAMGQQLHLLTSRMHALESK